MTTATPTKPLRAPEPRGGFTPSAFWTLFRMTVARQLQARRLVVVALLFSLPALFALLARYYNPDDFDAADVERVLIFALIPQALLPLASLVYASGMIRDEIDDQTLTYLLIRPIPRWAIYVAKLLATFFSTALLTSVFTAAAFAAIHGGTPAFWEENIPARALQTAGLMALSLAAYTALFGGLSLFVRRTLVAGVTYIVLFEGVVANIDFLVRKLTIMYYFRVLCVRWLDQPTSDWSMDLETAPDAATCVATLLGTALVLGTLAALTFGYREFRVKTPDAG